MALVKQLDGCKTASSSELGATSNQGVSGLPAARNSEHAAWNEEGAEIAEAALVLPLVFMFLLGIVWFGRVFNIYTTITQAAQQGAITAARASCATCGNLQTPDGSDFTTSGTVLFVVGSVLQASNLDPEQIVANSNPPAGCNTTKNVTICHNVQLNAAPSAIPAFCDTRPLEPNCVAPWSASNIHFSFIFRSRR